MKILSKQFLKEVAIPNVTLLVVVMSLGLYMSVNVAFLAIAFIFRLVGAWIHYRTVSKYYRKSVIDQLTGLHNRSFNYTTMNKLVSEQKDFHFLLLDLDRFKTINDTLGHGVGDKLLQAVGKRLSSCLRNEDIISRLGGDEFGIIIRSDKFDVQAFCERLISVIEKPFSVDDYDLNLGASIGVAISGQHGSDVDTIIKNADAAMYHAKREKTGYHIFTAELEVIGFENLIILNELRSAITRKELYNVYQPKIDLRTRKVAGVECLCRWDHEKHGLIPTDKFIKMAEQEGMINDLLFVVLENAFRDQLILLENGIDIPFSINISAENLADSETVAKIITMIEWFGINPEKLIFEVTETAIVKNLENTIKSLILLNSFGIKLSVDDFGTGYSSYFYLKHLPIGELKIDKTFIDDALDTVQDYMIVNSIITLAQNAKCTSVAEGVETKEQAELLENLHCNFAQGYYFSKGVEIGAFIDFCKNSEYRV